MEILWRKKKAYIYIYVYAQTLNRALGVNLIVSLIKNKKHSQLHGIPLICFPANNIIRNLAEGSYALRKTPRSQLAEFDLQNIYRN